MNTIMIAFLALIAGGVLVVLIFTHYERVYSEEETVEEAVKEFRKIRKELEQIRKEIQNDKEDNT